jgi:hypothetical protein
MFCLLSHIPTHVHIYNIDLIWAKCPIDIAVSMSRSIGGVDEAQPRAPHSIFTDEKLVSKWQVYVADLHEKIFQTQLWVWPLRNE